MRLAFLIAFVALFSVMTFSAQTPEELSTLWEKNHLSNKFPSDVRHADLKAYLERLRDMGLKIDEVGRSNAGREIYQIEFGRGPLKVFMWSQMHGDEPTATSALVDMFAFLQQNREADWVKLIEEKLTIRAVPMVNPDGAELYQRRNLQQIDINRDARALQTPEGRLLKKLRDDWNPAVGFNLHNQNSLTAVANTGRQASISLLVVYGDAAKTPSDGIERNKRIASAIIQALSKFIPDNIARYDDGYTSTAFGDNFTAWGTPVILVETGGLHGRDEMYLVKMNFIAFLTALDSIADGSEQSQSPEPYMKLRNNASGSLYSYIFRGANILDPANPTASYRADIGVIAERRRASFTPASIVREVGDLSGLRALEEYSAEDFNVVQKFGKLRLGELAELLFYKRDRKVDWRVRDIEKEFPPDAVFSGGKWVKGDGLLTRK
jgi:hypothetical protein